MSEVSLAQPAQWRGRLQLIALCAVFIGPVVAAYMLYFANQGSHSFGNKANGQLLDPVMPLESFSVPNWRGGELGLDELRGGWTIIQFSDQPCAESCQRNRTLFRDIWLALGKDAKRVKRWFIAPDISDGVATDFPQLRLLDTASATGLSMQLKQAGQQASEPLPDCAHCSYLVDPNGNVVMRYPAEQPPTEIFKDLRLLLKVSQIG